MKDLKEKTLRGGVARLCAQAANFLVRLGSLMVLARRLDPKDFGLVGMVTAFTGVLSLFRDFGLSAATIQRDAVTDEQISTLFWINLWVGAMLTALSIGLAPAIAKFYHEPELLGVTAVLGAGFLFNAAGVQHGALLQRQMRFTALAVINTVALLAGELYCYCEAPGWLRILVAGSNDGCRSTDHHDWFSALSAAWVPGMPRRRCRRSFDDALRGDGDFKRPARVSGHKF